MKMNDKSKINVILLSVIIVLVVTFGFSFKCVESAKDKREVVKTSLVNPKYKDSIMRFELRRDDEFIVLKKENDIWVCSDDNKNFIIAENKKISEFINTLTEVRNLSKISYKQNDLSSFGFNSTDQFIIRYYIASDNFYDLNFGNHDFSLSNRYVMGGNHLDIYEVDSSFERYLYTALNQWSDPYIISRNINGEYKLSDVQRVIKRTVTKDGSRTQTITPSNSEFTDYVSTLLELRHGGAASLPEQIGDDTARSVPSLELTLEMGDTSEYNLRFFPNEVTGKITVVCIYDFAQNRNRRITYTVEISEWTYEKF